MKKRIIVLFFLGFFILSCTPESRGTTTPISSKAQPLTATFVPTIFSSETPTELSKIYPSSFDLPDWIKDTQTMLLAVPITEIKSIEIISAKMAFINPLTEERFEIPFPSNDSFYFWQDNSYFGFLNVENKKIYLVDLRTGQVAEKSASPESVRLLSTGNHLAPLKLKADPLSPQNTIFDYLFSYWGSPYSLNTDYVANSNDNGREETIIVNNTITGKVVWESNPLDGYYDVHFLWSPVNNSLLAIVKGKYNKFDSFPVSDTTLDLIDIETGKTISSNKTDAGRIQWSADGTKILYRNALSDYWNFGYSFTDAPCFFDIETRKESCIWRIPNRPISKEYSLITTDDYQWGADGKSIYFTYSYRSQNEMIGKLCNYNLVNGIFTCTIDNLSASPNWKIDWKYGWRIANYNLSPDEKYIHFCLDSNSPLSDDQSGESKDVLIDVNGTNLTMWASQKKLDWYSRCSYSSIWRPLP